MATIKDVAKLAGVSTTTVSHVINETRHVADETKQIVLKAIEELHYSPSAVARSLKVNTTKSIGMIVTTSEAPYFAEIIHAVEDQCYRQGYSLFLCNTQNNPEKIKNHVDMLAKKRVDGILVMCSEYKADSLDLLKGFNAIPMVVMDWGPLNPNTDRILDNSFEGGYLAGKHLVDNGHTEIGYLSAELTKTTARKRYEGFLKALHEAGLQMNPDWLLEGSFEPEDGYECMNRLLAQPKCPTAVFCCNDIMAFGAISAITEKGLRVPDDISIIGYDNVHISRFCAPPLTTIHQSKARLGEQALKLLFDRINTKSDERSTIEIHPELVIRKSVKKRN
ncbi:HTH-type transcriptional repressor PurR [Actinobacillus porcinus]|uniref:HTH-type transcriptional repressor PurR n=1 Tax=Actinobacillus porcinus TaxID=51048 RepID=A0ABY6TJA3_9PAST|nr:HTH-type transcriptional repressor PurR [Actinobacillus porcinus]MDD7544962.1 HTH-type transcriptional repressor PurR [Actinobacillus porcinus]MDY5849066.1 HTH-type transcriptional repressor PurR [Actinobacillus porcinus]MDY6215964.1 HTH-type transcriptional repressor PurR [Actinobacillus porcinus]VFY93022.1 DNA-binding transcriptional repressor PurR [Actinobacillus porcinus]VTU07670.1 DNA-binding transcriptional repressor PurR [Actinobacillus porcinus]